MQTKHFISSIIEVSKYKVIILNKFRIPEDFPYLFVINNQLMHWRSQGGRGRGSNISKMTRSII